MHSPFVKLVALVCIALQAMLGVGMGLAQGDDSCASDSCGCFAACCNDEPQGPSCCREHEAARPARSPACCCATPSRAPSQPPPRHDHSSVKQIRFTPARVTTLTWLPATLSPAPRVVAKIDTPATRTSCGICTTHIVV